MADPATTALRGGNALPSVSTPRRFLAGADLGRVAKAAAANRVMPVSYTHLTLPTIYSV